MSPEQATGRASTRARICFRSAASFTRWRRASAPSLAIALAAVLQRLIERESLVPPRALNPAIPERLDAIIRRALQTDKAQRYQTAAEMLRDLRAFARGTVGYVPLPSADAKAAEPAAARRKPWLDCGSGGRNRPDRARRLAILLATASASPAAERPGQHPDCELRQQHGRGGIRRDPAHRAEGPAGTVAVSRHRSRRSHRRGARPHGRKPATPS